MYGLFLPFLPVHSVCLAPVDGVRTLKFLFGWPERRIKFGLPKAL